MMRTSARARWDDAYLNATVYALAGLAATLAAILFSLRVWHGEMDSTLGLCVVFVGVVVALFFSAKLTRCMRSDPPAAKATSALKRELRVETLARDAYANWK